MTQQRNLLGAILIMLLVPSCGQVQTPAVTPIPSTTFSPTVVPSHTPRRTSTPAPTATTIPGHSGQFQQVVSFPKKAIDRKTKACALADGSVWIITSQSVFRWDGQELNPIKTEEGMRADVDESGRLWSLQQGMDDIIWSYEPTHQKWTSYPLPRTTMEEKGYNFAYPFDLIVDHSGDIWAYLEYCGGASCGTGYKLHRIHDREWLQVFEKSLSDPIYQDQPLILDKNGEGWLFSGETVYQLQEDTPKQVAEIPILSTDLSPDGKMWAVSWDALWMLKP